VAESLAIGNVLKLLIYRSKTKINAATAIPPNIHNKRLGLFPLSMIFPFIYTHKGRLKKFQTTLFYKFESVILCRCFRIWGNCDAGIS